MLYGQKPLIDSNSIWALKNICLQIENGEIVGVIGQNGAGKSTFLRLIAGISTPTSGSLEVNGSIGTLLDLSAGLQMFRTGRENIKLRLELLGVSKLAAKLLESEIIEFAELESCIDNVISTYSTGMRMRLAFSIATSIQPDLLLIDEVLAVGDEFFSVKSFKRIENLARSGCTCIIVSHDWSKIFRIASRIIWLEQGCVHMDGKPEDILHPFLLSANAFEIDNKVELVSVKILNEAMALCRKFSSGDSILLEVDYKKNSDVNEFAIITGVMTNNTGESVISAYSGDDGVTFGEVGMDDGKVYIKFPSLPLHPGKYNLSLMIVSPDQGPFPIHYHSVWGPLTSCDSEIEVIGECNLRRSPLLALNPIWRIGSIE